MGALVGVRIVILQICGLCVCVRTCVCVCIMRAGVGECSGDEEREDGSG